MLGSVQKANSILTLKSIIMTKGELHLFKLWFYCFLG